MKEKTKEFTLDEMQKLHKIENPQVMFGYFLDNYCWGYLEKNKNCYAIFILLDGKVLKRYGMTDEDALIRAVEEEDYTEAARLQEKIRNGS